VKFRRRSLIVYNSDFILGSTCVGSELIKRIATDTSNSYYIWKSHTCHITSSLLQHHERKRWTLALLANSTFSNCWPRAVHLLLMCHFTLSTYSLKMNTISFKWITHFHWFCDFLSWCMCYPVWIHCCKWPNRDFCILQGSVATVLRWSGQN